jgi:hypothetical protein
LEDLKGRDYLGDISAGGRIILVWSLKNWTQLAQGRVQCFVNMAMNLQVL